MRIQILGVFSFPAQIYNHYFYLNRRQKNFSEFWEKKQKCFTATNVYVTSSSNSQCVTQVTLQYTAWAGASTYFSRPDALTLHILTNSSSLTNNTLLYAVFFRYLSLIFSWDQIFSSASHSETLSKRPNLTTTLTMGKIMVLYMPFYIRIHTSNSSALPQ